MGNAISKKLPTIQIKKYIGPPPPTGEPLLDTLPVAEIHYINFNYKHFASGGQLAINFIPEYANDFTAADANRSLGRRLLGFRLSMQLQVTDIFLTGGSPSYEKELFEDNMNYMAHWDQYSNGLIMVAPWSDLPTYSYNCRLDSYVKSPYQFNGDDGFKTVGFMYQISLTAKQLTQTYPVPSSRPWA